jgi:hypothetical protein
MPEPIDVAKSRRHDAHAIFGADNKAEQRAEAHSRSGTNKMQSRNRRLEVLIKLSGASKALDCRS